jgi:hypothetical protein
VKGAAIRGAELELHGRWIGALNTHGDIPYVKPVRRGLVVSPQMADQHNS